MNKLFYILIFFALTVSLSAQSKTKDVLFFEVYKHTYAHQSSHEKILLIYQSGRIDCRFRSELHFESLPYKQKRNCFQINQKTLTELVSLAKQKDFLTAETNYSIEGGGFDMVKSITIDSFLKQKKAIQLTTALPKGIGGDVPKVIRFFWNKIEKIDEEMKLEFE